MMKYIDYINYLKTALRKPETVPYSPPHINIEPTTACNISCQVCPRKDLVDNPEFLSFGDFKNIVDQCLPKKVSLNGLGETFLNKEIFHMLEYLRNKNINVVTSTNGIFLERDAKDIVSSSLSMLRISLDSNEKELYQKIRGSDNFEQIVSGIKIINRLMKESKNNRLCLRLEYVIHNDNVERLKEFIYLAHLLKIKYINFQVLSNPVDETDTFRIKLVNNFQKDVFLNQIKDALEYSNKLRIQTSLPSLVSNFKMVWKKYQSKTTPSLKLSHHCINPWITTYITVNGEMLFCCRMRDKNAVAGNVFVNDFHSVWNNNKFQSVRINLKKGRDVHFVCRDCIPTTLSEIIRLKLGKLKSF